MSERVAVAAGCPVYVGSCDEIVWPEGELFVVTDSDVSQYHWFNELADKLKSFTIVVKAGEQSKDGSSLLDVLSALAQMGADRSSCVVAVGGGVVGDLSGFVAAVYMRGIRWVNLATSLLAQVDAAIGGKTAIDLPEGKNLVGAFHHPEFVWCDVSWLETLPKEQFRNGVAEVIKTAMIADAEMTDWLGVASESDAEEMVKRCVKIKAGIVTEDPYETTGRRAVLNFGHTLGHAIEHESGYTLLHGEAVMIGMVLEARIGSKLGLTNPEVGQALESLAGRWGLPTSMPNQVDPELVMMTVLRDKKNVSGSVSMALPEGVGSCRLVRDISQDVIRECLV